MWAWYQNFAVGSEASSYPLHVSGYAIESTAADALSSTHEGMKWSTPDQDNDASSRRHCAQELKSPFWFNACGSANPLGAY